jgi:protein SCO1
MSTAIYQGQLREKNLLERIVASKAFWAIFLLLSFSYPIIRSVNRELPDRLPVYHKIPQFNFTNEMGQKTSSESLKGRVYMANFIFTTCPTSCPGIVEKLRKVQKRIRGVGDRAKIVTFTVDPENDNPEVLYKFARKNGINPKLWTFLTGDYDAMNKLIVGGFKVPMGKLEEVNKKFNDSDITMFDIAHTEKIVLVDQLGQTRGYYSLDDESVNRLMVDVGLLVNRPPEKLTATN